MSTPLRISSLREDPPGEISSRLWTDRTRRHSAPLEQIDPPDVLFEHAESVASTSKLQVGEKIGSKHQRRARSASALELQSFSKIGYGSDGSRRGIDGFRPSLPPFSSHLIVEIHAPASHSAVASQIIRSEDSLQDVSDPRMVHEQNASAAPLRVLRERKAAQLAPYTTEMQRYKRRLMRNDWHDAVVVSRDFARVERERRRTELREPSVAEDTLSTSPAGGSRNDHVGIHEKTALQISKVRLGGRGEPMRPTIDMGQASPTDPNLSDSSVLSAISTSSEQAPIRRNKKRFRVFSPPFSGRQDSPSASGSSSLNCDTHATYQTQASPAMTSSRESSVMLLSGELQSSEEDPSLRSRHSEGRDYVQLFKMLKRTMPARMARAHIADLKAMDEEDDGDSEAEFLPRDTSKGAIHASSSSIRPGEARKVMRSKLDRSGQNRFQLAGDSDSSSSRSPSPSWRQPGSSASPILMPSSSDDGDDDAKSDSSSSAQEDNRLPWNLSGGRKVSARIQRESALGSRDDDIDALLNINPREHRTRQVATGFDSAIRHLPDWRRDEARHHVPKKRRISRKACTSRTFDAVKMRMPGRSQLSLFASSKASSDIERESFFLADAQAVRQSLKGDYLEPRPSPAFGPDSSSRNATRGSQEEQAESILKALKGMEGTGSQRSPLLGSVGQSGYSSHARATHPAPTRKIARRDIHTRSVRDLEGNVTANVRSWPWIDTTSLDFDLKAVPFGFRCDPHGFVGRGRLFELMQCMSGRPSVSSPNSKEIEENFRSPLCDIIERSHANFLTTSISDDRIKLLCNQLEDMLAKPDIRFGIQASNQAADAIASLIHLILCKMEDFRRSRLKILIRLKWIAVETLWTSFRLNDTCEGMEGWLSATLEACEGLMDLLLACGLHDTIRPLRKSMGSGTVQHDTSAVADLDDITVDVWIRLLHVLGSEPVMRASKGKDFLFWTIFERALKRYQDVLSRQKHALLVAENTWFSVLAICSLARFSAATGTYSSKSAIRSSGWSLISHAFDIARKSYSHEALYGTERRIALQKDQYIRLILRRSLDLIYFWKWDLHGIEPLLQQIYDMFESFRLQDLPTERHHNFPPFLTSFDVNRLLSQDGLEDETAFQLFLHLLALASQTIEMQGERQRLEKRITRLLSRFSPVRTMRFTESNAPTALERSALINHYSMAILHLHLAPSSYQQRLLQIQQYLHIGSADRKSQIVGIRAMMYAAVVMRHNKCEMSQVMAWFKSVFNHLVAKSNDRHQQAAGIKHNMEKHEEDAGKHILLLLTASLRALQYVIATPSLPPCSNSRQYPDLLFLDTSWTQQILQSGIVCRDHGVALEVLRLIEVLVRQRDDATKQINDEGNVQLDESQEDLFDDHFDYDDVGVLAITGYQKENAAFNNIEGNGRIDDLQSAKWLGNDAHFADHINEVVSPAIFQLIQSMASFQPTAISNKSSLPCIQAAKSDSKVYDLMQQAARHEVGRLAVELWSRCAFMLVVEYDRRSWSSYLHHGREDLRHLADLAIRQEVTTQFLSEILSITKDRDRLGVGRSGSSVYAEIRSEVWTAYMAALTSSQSSESLARFMQLVVSFEQSTSQSMHAGSTLVDGIPSDFEIAKASKLERWEALRRALGNLPAILATQPQMLSSAISAICRVLSCLRQDLTKLSKGECLDARHPMSVVSWEVQQEGRSADSTSPCLATEEMRQQCDYLIIGSILRLCRMDLGNAILRGIEWNLTQTEKAYKQVTHRSGNPPSAIQ